jgi:hypothetical protein
MAAPLLPLTAAVVVAVAGGSSATPPEMTLALPPNVVPTAGTQVAAAASACPRPLRWVCASRPTNPALRQLLLLLLREGSAARQAAAASPPLGIGQVQAPPARALRLGCEAPRACACAWRRVRAREGRMLLLGVVQLLLLLLLARLHAVACACSTEGAGACQAAAAWERGGRGKHASPAADHVSDAEAAAEPAEAACASVQVRPAEGSEGGGRGQARGHLQQALPAAAAAVASVAGPVGSRCAVAAAAARTCPSASARSEECGRCSAEEGGRRLTPAVGVGGREARLRLLLLQAGEAGLPLPAALWEAHLSLHATLQHCEEGPAHAARPSQPAAAVALAACSGVMGDACGTLRLRLQLQVPAGGVAAAPDRTLA